MKAEELRIGNLIKWVDKLPKGDCEVIGLGEHQIAAICPRLKFQGFEKDFEGIPLTSEWLERFGFTRKQVYEQVDEYTSPNRLFKIQTDESLFAISGGNELLEKLELNHVHQLQNLYFALTGEELTIQAK